MADRSTATSRRTAAAAGALALLVALFMLSGRWSVARVFHIEDSLLYQVRFWVALAMVLVALIPGVPSRRRPGLGALALFVGYFAASALWAPSRAIAVDKVLELLLLAAAVWSAHRLSSWVPPGELTKALWTVLTLLLAMFALLGLAAGTSGGRLAVLGGGPNVFGRNMGLLALVCTAASLRGRRRPALVVAAIVAGALVLLSGSRGALVATAVGMAALLYAGRLRVSRAFVSIAILVALGVFGALYTDVGQSAVAAFEHRVLDLTLGQDYDSGRAGLYQSAIDLGLQSPVIGHGVGAFKAHGLGVYPHNLFLEAFAEGGFLGVLVLLGVLGRGLYFVVTRAPGVAAIDTAGFVLLLVAAQFSGDFYDSRGVFLLALLLEPRRE